MPRRDKATFAQAQAFGAIFEDVFVCDDPTNGRTPDGRSGCNPLQEPLAMGDGTYFAGAHLGAASFKNAKITGAVFSNSKLDNANFASADVRNSSFSGASLFSTDFFDAKISNSFMNSVKAEQADFTAADLSGAEMRNSEFQEAIFRGPPSGLKRADEDYKTSVAFAGSWGKRPRNDDSGLSKWYFTPAQAENRVDFSGSNFSEAVLSNFNFTGAILCDINDDDPENADNGSRYYDNDLDQVMEPTDDPNGYFEVKSGKCVPSVTSQEFGTNRYASYKDAQLDGADFGGVNASHLNFDGADFTDADLNNTDFTKASLYQVNFSEADLIEAIFTGASLKEGVFFKADLTNTNFTGASLNKADFSEADLTNTDFTKASLYQVNFYKAKLPGTTDAPIIFGEQNLQLIHSTGPLGEVGFLDLETVQFVNTNLESANFTNAINISKDTFQDSNLTFADFTNAKNISIDILKVGGNTLCETMGLLPNNEPYGEDC
jgi:uncharacterized protein YjbI with pentapeptide repeats